MQSDELSEARWFNLVSPSLRKQIGMEKKNCVVNPSIVGKVVMMMMMISVEILRDRTLIVLLRVLDSVYLDV